MKDVLSHLERLESDAIHIFREAVAEGSRPVLLFSAGKDSTVLAHLALRAFYPARPPFPLLHIDSTWEFRAVLEFRDRFARQHGFEVIAVANEEGRAAGLNPFDHGDAYTHVMRTEPLKKALNTGQYDIIFGGARRDEEKSRAKERIFSIRSAAHSWDPKQQRPELWTLYNTRLAQGQTARVYPLSNWTEHDIWNYIIVKGIDLVPLYYSRERPVVERRGRFIVIDDEARMRWRGVERVVHRKVRFRTLGCWPVTGAIESEAMDAQGVLAEMLVASTSEREGRVSDAEEGGSLEQKKREGYF
ncbi:MAG: sulfate adenylyltransferase subunit CysD [Proteobacteria bacterium]|nr:sulfate adenylyltransferase subunit CysD [Pseudomonadota bacterium]